MKETGALFWDCWEGNDEVRKVMEMREGVWKNTARDVIKHLSARPNHAEICKDELIQKSARHTSMISPQTCKTYKIGSEDEQEFVATCPVDEYTTKYIPEYSTEYSRNLQIARKLLNGIGVLFVEWIEGTYLEFLIENATKSETFL